MLRLFPASKVIKTLPLFLILATITGQSAADPVAFPGAEGYGASATGGRGGQVIKVTNLNGSGPGSLQTALDVSGPRIIIFEVSGVINTSEIIFGHGDFTLAGETAPGAGITIAGRLSSAYDFSITNFIIRHLRIRPPDLTGDQGDAIRIANNSHFILDHISVSWGSDETVDVYQSHDFTVQWSTIEESATHAGHPDGNYHNFGLINGPEGSNVSIHHTVFAHHRQRTPAIANGSSDVVNNLVYNFWRGFNHHNPADTSGFNFIGNYYKDGPDSNNPIAILIDDEDGSSGPYYYLADLYYNGVASDPWDLAEYYPSSIFPPPSQASGPYNTPQITTHSSTQTYQLLLEQAGAWPRDTVTLRTMNEIMTGTGFWGRNIPANLLEGLTAAPPPTDTDGDGMPDNWETARGLNPVLIDHNGDHDNDGYTNIEEYLHFCSDLLIYGQNGILPGDINADTVIDLRDAIVALQISSGDDTATINENGDVNGDNIINLAEAIFALQQSSTN